MDIPDEVEWNMWRGSGGDHQDRSNIYSNLGPTPIGVEISRGAGVVVVGNQRMINKLFAALHGRMNF